MDKFAAMRVFVKIAEAGSLSAAGRQLGLSVATATPHSPSGDACTSSEMECARRAVRIGCGNTPSRSLSLRQVASYLFVEGFQN